MSSPPPPEVVGVFGGTGSPVARPRLQPGGPRLALPLVAAGGALRFDGWEAFQWFTGWHRTGRWEDRVAIVRSFAAAFSDVDPATLPARDDPWAVADRLVQAGAGPLRDHALARALGPASASTAVVHADLAGNTLLDPVDGPAVIDLSLLARPVEWSVAVLVVDVIAFEGAPLDLLRTASGDPDFPQLVAQALLFRMTVDVLLGADPHSAYGRAEAAVLGLLSGTPG